MRPAKRPAEWIPLDTPTTPAGQEIRSSPAPNPGARRSPFTSDSACPSCGAALAPRPKAKKKCPSCGQFVFVRTHPEDRERVLANEEGVRLIDSLWAERSAVNRFVGNLVQYGITEEGVRARQREMSTAAGRAVPTIDAALELCEEARHRYARTDLHAAKMIAFSEAWIRYEAGRDFFPVLQESARYELLRFQDRRLARDGIVRVKVMSSQGCPPCRALDGRSMPLADALGTMPIPNRACQHVVADRPEGMCRCLYVVDLGF